MHQFMYLIIVALLCCFDTISGRKDGAPLGSCISMTPGHGNNTAQELSSIPYQIVAAPSGTSGSKKTYKITLSPKAGATTKTTFKGFFIQARGVSGDSNPIGTWDVSSSMNNAKGVDCGDVTSSAITHVTNDFKQEVTGTWSPPDGHNGNVVFMATVVKEFTTFWVGLQSQPISSQALLSESSNASLAENWKNQTATAIEGGLDSSKNNTLSITNSTLTPATNQTDFPSPIGSALNQNGSSYSSSNSSNSTYASSSRKLDAMDKFQLICFALILSTLK